MAYCVHCGVELAATEKRCPLCGTPVHDPACPAPEEVQPTYPGAPVKETKHGALAVLALALLIPFLSVLACNLTIQGRITWARYVLIWAPLIYTVLFVPAPVSYTHLDVYKRQGWGVVMEESVE